MTRLIQLAVHNWWLKLLALGMAWTLWLVVTQGPQVETGMLVNFGVRHLPAELQVEGQLPTPIYIQLRGPERMVEGLRRQEVGVTVDLTGATAGEKEIVLEPSHARVPPGIEVVGFIPERVRLRLALKKTHNGNSQQ